MESSSGSARTPRRDRYRQYAAPAPRARCSAISGAKLAKKDEAGQAHRLKKHHAALDAETKEVEKRLLEVTDDSTVQSEMRHALSSVCRRATEALTTVVQEEAVLQRKQLHDKDMYWKLKLETNRVANVSASKPAATAGGHAQHHPEEPFAPAARLQLLGNGASALTDALTASAGWRRPRRRSRIPLMGLASTYIRSEYHPERDDEYHDVRHLRVTTHQEPPLALQRPGQSKTNKGEGRFT